MKQSKKKVDQKPKVKMGKQTKLVNDCNMNGTDADDINSEPNRTSRGIYDANENDTVRFVKKKI